MLSCDRVVNQASLKEELKCRICFGVLRDPQECKNCENCFCLSCLEEWFKSNYICPMKCSQEPDFKSKAHKIIRNMLSELVICCQFQEFGCQAQISYDKLEDHENFECEFEMLECNAKEQGCDVRLKRKEMTTHKIICTYMPTQCDFCKLMVKRKEIQAHWMHCEEAELSCEFCHSVVKRKSYLIHVNALCEEFVMNCGRCSGTYKRKFRAFHDCIRHLQNCQKTMSEDIIVLKEMLITKDKKIKDLENKMFLEIREMKLKIDQIQSQEFPNKQDNFITQNHNQSSSSQLELVDKSFSWDTNTTLNFICNKEALNTADLNLERILNVPFQQSFDEVFLALIRQQNLYDARHLYQLTINLQSDNLQTQVLQPVYLFIGVVQQDLYSKLQSQTYSFDSIYQQLAEKCLFQQVFSQQFQQQFKFKVRAKTKKIQQSNIEESKDQVCDMQTIEIEDTNKNSKLQFQYPSIDPVLVFGIYSKTNLELSYFKDIQVILN
eukprot:403345930